MDNRKLVEKIMKNLNFEVESIHDSKIVQNNATSSRIDPMNVKIKVRKKEMIEQNTRGFISNNQSEPEKRFQNVRLVSSQQTIMSFDMLVEDAKDKKMSRKPGNNIFDRIKPGICLGATTDEDDQPYMPDQDLDMSQVSKSDGKLLNQSPLTNNTDGTRKRTGRTFLGKKCKPGGCLDPPFTEDDQPYMSDQDLNMSPVSKSDGKLLNQSPLTNNTDGTRKRTERTFLGKKCKPGGCLDPPFTEDGQPYMSDQDLNMSPVSKSDGKLLNQSPLTNNTDGTRKRTERTFLGKKCKPGGCLDPPFTEDTYSYLPSAKDTQKHSPNTCKDKLKEKVSDARSNEKKNENHRNKTRDLSVNDDKNVEKSDSVINVCKEDSTTNLVINYLPHDKNNDSKRKEDSENKLRQSNNDPLEMFFPPKGTNRISYNKVEQKNTEKNKKKSKDHPTNDNKDKPTKNVSNYLPDDKDNEIKMKEDSKDKLRHSNDESLKMFFPPKGTKRFSDDEVEQKNTENNERKSITVDKEADESDSISNAHNVDSANNTLINYPPKNNEDEFESIGDSEDKLRQPNDSAKTISCDEVEPKNAGNNKKKFEDLLSNENKEVEKCEPVLITCEDSATNLDISYPPDDKNNKNKYNIDSEDKLKPSNHESSKNFYPPKEISQNSSDKIEQGSKEGQPYHPTPKPIEDNPPLSDLNFIPLKSVLISPSETFSDIIPQTIINDNEEMPLAPSSEQSKEKQKDANQVDKPLTTSNKDKMNSPTPSGKYLRTRISSSCSAIPHGQKSDNEISSDINSKASVEDQQQIELILSHEQNKELQNKVVIPLTERVEQSSIGNNETADIKSNSINCSSAYSIENKKLKHDDVNILQPINIVDKIANPTSQTHIIDDSLKNVINFPDKNLQQTSTNLLLKDQTEKSYEIILNENNEIHKEVNSKISPEKNLLQEPDTELNLMQNPTAESNLSEKPEVQVITLNSDKSPNLVQSSNELQNTLDKSKEINCTDQDSLTPKTSIKSVEIIDNFNKNSDLIDLNTSEISIIISKTVDFTLPMAEATNKLVDIYDNVSKDLTNGKSQGNSSNSNEVYKISQIPVQFADNVSEQQPNKQNNSYIDRSTLPDRTSINAETDEKNIPCIDHAMSPENRKVVDPDTILPGKKEGGRADVSARSDNFLKSVSLNLAFHSHMNDENEWILKTISNESEVSRYPEDNVTNINSRIEDSYKQTYPKFIIPINPLYDMTIEINKSYPQSDTISENLKTNVAPNVMSNVYSDANTTNRLTEKQLMEHTVNQNDPILYDALTDIYEQELLPLQEMIKTLKNEVDALAEQRTVLKKNVICLKKTSRKTRFN